MELTGKQHAEPASQLGLTGIRIYLRLEGALAAGIGLWAYALLDASWLMLAATILLPDLAFLAYLNGRRFGIYCYNLTHSYLSPAVFFAVTAYAGFGLAEELALVWVVHIGVDRLIGYGLKLQTDDKRTHLSG